MVQVFTPSPRAMQAGKVGESIGQGLAKSMGLAQAEKSFADAQGDPMKLATALGRLVSVSPDLARAAGPMYQGMLRSLQGQAIREGAGASGEGQLPMGAPMSRVPVSQPEAVMPDFSQVQQQRGGAIPVRETTPGFHEKSIMAPETLAVPMWSPEQKMQRESFYMDLGFLPEEAQKRAADDESRYLKNPDIYEKRQKQTEERRVFSNKELRRQLETKTQRKFDSDDPNRSLMNVIPGEYLIGLEKGMARDIIENPQKTMVEIADDWSTRALDTVKAKEEFKTLSKTTGVESLLKGRETLSKLENYGDIFRKSGNEEEYWKLLQGDMNLSPQGAASIAFGVRPDIEGLISEKVIPMTPNSLGDPVKQSRNFANDLADSITSKDSLLAISWKARKRNPMFNERAFFDQISRNKDLYNLTPLQERELAQGASGIIPYWGDFLTFPWLGG